MINEERYNFLTSDDDTTITITQEVSQTMTHAHDTSAGDTANAGNAKRKNEDNSFSALDAMRHPFDVTKKVPKTEYIAGLFVRGGITVIVGAPGVGKTILMQKIFTDLSNVAPNEESEILYGFAKETKPRKSIIIAGEFGENGLIERAQEFGFDANKHFVEVIDLITAEENGINLSINEKEGQQNIEHLASSLPDLLILDSFATLYTGKENENGEILKVFRWLLKIARQFNIAVVVVHHARKRLANEQQKPLTLDDVIGGNGISRCAARVIAIERNSKLGANLVTCLKSWGPYFKPFAFKVKDGLYKGIQGASYIDIDLNPDEIDAETLNTKNSKPAPASQAENQRREVLAILKARNTHNATIQETREILGIDENDERAKNTLNQTLTRMVREGVIIRVNNKRGVYSLPEIEQPNGEDNNTPPIDDEPKINFEMTDVMTE